LGVSLGGDVPSKKSLFPSRFVGKYGYAMRLVKSGKRIIGSDVDLDLKQIVDEERHEVTLTHSFYIGETEVTVGFWEMIMSENPTRLGGGACFRSDYPLVISDDFPVFCIDFVSALEMANLLSEWEGFESCYDLSGYRPRWRDQSCNGYRLPTEAEWEAAAMGTLEEGDESSGMLYAGGDNLNELGWSSVNSGLHPNPVAQKKANDHGLYDMSGNVWEWVWDWYGAYDNSVDVDPIGPGFGYQRVIRGGSWANSPDELRVANRFSRPPSHRSAQIGVRFVRRPK